MAKPDGTTRTIEVQFGSGSLITFETDTPVEVGDTFERKLPNGAVELWEITKSTYFRSMGGIPANYQCKTRQKKAESPKMTGESSAKLSSNEVFIVHGHDEAAVDALSDFLRRIGLKPMTWGHARRRGGPGLKTNHDRVKACIESGGAVVVLFTPDEVAQRAPHLGGDPQQGYQPRPNVIFEAGWAFGAHREKTVIVQVGEFQHRLSDIDGIQCVRMASSRDLNALATELETIGCPVDRSDDSYNDSAKFPALFEQAPRLEPMAEEKPAEPEEYEDDTLIEMLKQSFGRYVGFLRFADLDERAVVPKGTSKRLGERAAREAGRLEKAVSGGLTLNDPLSRLIGLS